MFDAPKGDASATKMFASLSRDFNAINDSGCMVKLATILFITPLNGPPSTWNPATGGTDPLHLVKTERQEVKAPLMAILRSTVRDRSERVEVGPNLARVDRPLHQGRSNVDRRDTVSIDESRQTRFNEVDWKNRLSGQGNTIT
jgi:hypothetical protein